MIYLLHGENLVDSRRALIKLKQSYQDIQSIPSKKLSEELINEKMGQSNALFGGKSAILIENFLGEWEMIPEKTGEVDIILWSPGKVKTTPKYVKVQSYESYQQFPAFKFSDALLYKNEKQALEILGEMLKKKEPPEKIIGALGRSFALLFAYKSKNSLPISSYVLEKIQQQANYWTIQQIKNAFVALLKADVEIKEGVNPQAAFTFLVSRLTV